MVLRKLFENSFVIEPHCSAWVAMNKIPKFDGTSGGMKRRIRRLVFPWAFGEENKKEPNYSEGVSYNVDSKLASNDWRDAFMLRLLHTMQTDLVVAGKIPNRCPYKPPAAVRASTDDIFQSQTGHGDEFFEWAFERLAADHAMYDAVSLSFNQVYKLYKNFCGVADDDEGYYIQKTDMMELKDLKEEMNQGQRCVLDAEKKGWIGIYKRKKFERRLLNTAEHLVKDEDSGDSSDEDPD